MFLRISNPTNQNTYAKKIMNQSVMVHLSSNFQCYNRQRLQVILKLIETTFGRLSYYSYRLYMRSSSLISLCTCIHASVKFLYFACIPFLLIFSPVDQAVTKHMEKLAKKFRIKVQNTQKRGIIQKSSVRFFFSYEYTKILIRFTVFMIFLCIYNYCTICYTYLHV